ncbi:MAG: type II CAAX endopeptidase family protein, partial [Anaerolineae bacterium]|nr:type II CAAX endopeptidase family protein [Anaerolineae bacterium]
MNSCPFIALTEEGKNALWRYALSFVLIVAIVLAGSSVITLPITLGAVPESSTVGFALELLGMGAMLLGALLVTRLLHGRSPSTLFGVARRLNWMVILSSGAVWAVLMAISVGINFVLSPQQFTVNAKFVEFLPTLLVGLVLIPLQTSAEEVLFRGYLLQAIGRVVRPPVLLSVVNGVLFVVPHLGNPEAQQETWLAAVQWFMGGFLPALLTLRHGTLDAALGIHAAN